MLNFYSDMYFYACLIQHAVLRTYFISYYEYNVNVVSNASMKPNPVHNLIDGVLFTFITSIGTMSASRICSIRHNIVTLLYPFL